MKIRNSIASLFALFIFFASFASWADGSLDALNNIYDVKPSKDENSSSATRVFNKSRASVVIIHCTRGTQHYTGSGFAVKRDGLIITNAHVVKPEGKLPQKIYVTHPDWNSKKYDAEIVRILKDRDLALIKVDRYFASPLGLSAKSAVVGDKVFALGNPGSGSSEISDGILTLTFTSGIINNTRRVINSNPCYQTTATINADHMTMFI